MLGFAFDGYPIYGAYGYKNTDGTGDIVRIKSSYSLDENATTRTNGPNINSTYFNGYFREDYTYTASNEPDYLDDHNGRFAVTPEYPNGTYAYYMTVDENWNSAYPYCVGPTFYGVYQNREVTSVAGNTTTYNENGGTTSINEIEQTNFNIFPNPASTLIAIQASGLVRENIKVELFDVTGKLVKTQQINAGQTISYFDTQTLYEGTYFVKLSSGESSKMQKILIAR